MLSPSALKSLLAQANSGGVKATLLLNNEGSLLSYAGVDDTECRVISAIAASIWVTYDRASKVIAVPTAQLGASKSGPTLQFVILDCEQGLAALASVSGTDFVVCSVADERCELGMLKKKLVAIVEYLKQPLTMSL